MREIEIKARVHDIPKLVNRLKRQGIVFDASVHQKDHVFAPGQIDSDNTKNCWLRLRNQDGKYTFTMKKSIKNELDSIEHEIQIDDMDEARGIISELGYKTNSYVEKTRRIAETTDGIVIRLDSVVSLGDFIELEIMSGDDVVGYDEIAEKLWRFAESIGVDRSDEVQVGYDVLMIESQK